MGGKSVLVTLQDASKEYGPPYTTLRDLIVRGHLERVQLGNQKRIWIRRADLEQLIQDGTGQGLLGK